jgi:hypothetical protein
MERSFLRVYFELATAHYSQAMHSPAPQSYALILTWREGKKLSRK